MIIERIKRQDGFTSAERAIAEYILEKASYALSLTSTELGKAAGTSQSAVIRFCKKIGYSSYRSFMIDLAEEFKERSVRKAVDLEKPFQKELKASEAKKEMKEIYHHILSAADSVIDDHILQRVYLRIKSASQIDIYGTGISSLSARQLAFDLQGYGFPCRFMDGDNAKYIDGITDTGSIMAIIYSFTGDNPLLNRIAEKCRKKGIYCLAFTGRFNTPLSLICNDALFFSPQHYDILDNISAEIGAMYLNHILLSMFLSKE